MPSLTVRSRANVRPDSSAMPFPEKQCDDAAFRAGAAQAYGGKPRAKGTSGRVYPLVYQGKRYAIKRFEGSTHDGNAQHWQLELRILYAIYVSALPKTRIVTLHCHWIDNTAAWMAFNYYAENMDQYLTREHRKLVDSTAAELFVGVAEGLLQLHRMGYLHRDLKTTNILMDGKVPMLADFGLSFPEGVVPKTNLGASAWHTPPEISYEECPDYSFAYDYWALGVIMDDMCLEAQYWRYALNHYLNEDGYAGNRRWIIGLKMAKEIMAVDYRLRAWTFRNLQPYRARLCAPLRAYLPAEDRVEDQVYRITSVSALQEMIDAMKSP